MCTESGATKEEDLRCRPFSAVWNDELVVSGMVTFCLPLLLLRFKGALQTNVQGGATYCLSDILCTDVSINNFPYLITGYGSHLTSAWLIYYFRPIVLSLVLFIYSFSSSLSLNAVQPKQRADINYITT